MRRGGAPSDGVVLNCGLTKKPLTAMNCGERRIREQAIMGPGMRAQRRIIMKK